MSLEKRFGVFRLSIYGQGQRPCPFDFFYLYPLLSILLNYAGGSFVCLFSLLSIAGELKRSFSIKLCICFYSQHALAMEAAILDAACQCLCVDLISFHSASLFLGLSLWIFALLFVFYY